MDLSDKHVFRKEAKITSAMLFEMIVVRTPKKGLILANSNLSSSTMDKIFRLDLQSFWWNITDSARTTLSQLQAWIGRDNISKKIQQKRLGMVFEWVLLSSYSHYSWSSLPSKGKSIIPAMDREAVQLVNKNLAK